MAPTPIKESSIYGDFSSIASRTNSKATANPTLDIVDAVEMSMDDFAEKLAISREIQDHPTLPHSQVIQETKTHRIKLEKEHNAEIVSYLTQKKKK